MFDIIVFAIITNALAIYKKVMTNRQNNVFTGSNPPYKLLKSYSTMARFVKEPSSLVWVIIESVYNPNFNI